MRRVSRWVPLLIFAVVGVYAPSATASAPSSSRSPERCPRAVAGLHRFMAGRGRTVALTFDDGPGRDARRIMAILRREHVTATFFNIGLHESSDPAAVRAMQAAGYALGDHTWDHRILRGMSPAQQATEIDSERRTQASVVGAVPCLLRPPGGEYDATTLALAAQRGMSVWNWSVDTEDWKAVGNAAPYWVNRIRTRAEAGADLDHPVILMHDEVGGNPATVAALPSVIAFYKARGYRFVDLFGRTAMTVRPRAVKTIVRTVAAPQLQHTVPVVRPAALPVPAPLRVVSWAEPPGHVSLPGFD
jgi:peptidoglycan/xylan/chitin deacetylase (PgdA/CDA1 family)